MIGIGITTWKRHAELHKRILDPLVQLGSDIGNKIAIACDSPEARDFVDQPKNTEYAELTALGGLNRGVAANKNRIFAWFLDDPRLSHLFLFEDDTFPIKAGWERWWLEGHKATGIGAFCWQPADFYQGATNSSKKGSHTAISTKLDGMAMLSITRKALEKVGGMHPAFKAVRYGNEHSEFMTRCHRARLTPWTNCTLLGCEEWIDSIDYREWRGIPRPEGDPSGGKLLFAKYQPQGLATFGRVQRDHAMFHDPHWPEKEELVDP